MNTMTDVWTTFGADRGPFVEVSYRYHADSDRIIKRVHDGETDYYATPCPEDVEWSGAEGVRPWKANEFTWEPVENPFDD